MNKPVVVVEIHGGVGQGWAANADVDVVLVDYDNLVEGDTLDPEDRTILERVAPTWDYAREVLREVDSLEGKN